MYRYLHRQLHKYNQSCLYFQNRVDFLQLMMDSQKDNEGGKEKGDERSCA